MSARYRAKNWLHGLEAADFSKFADFILGERVGLQIPTSDGGQQKLKPDWSIVLAFEHKLRKEAMRLAAGQSSSWLSWYRGILVSLTDCRWWFDSPLVRE